MCIFLTVMWTGSGNYVSSQSHNGFGETGWMQRTFAWGWMKQGAVIIIIIIIQFGQLDTIINDQSYI